MEAAYTGDKRAVENPVVEHPMKVVDVPAGAPASPASPASPAAPFCKAGGGDKEIDDLWISVSQLPVEQREKMMEILKPEIEIINKGCDGEGEQNNAYIEALKGAKEKVRNFEEKLAVAAVAAETLIYKHLLQRAKTSDIGTTKLTRLFEKLQESYQQDKDSDLFLQDLRSYRKEKLAVAAVEEETFNYKHLLQRAKTSDISTTKLTSLFEKLQKSHEQDSDFFLQDLRSYRSEKKIIKIEIEIVLEGIDTNAPPGLGIALRL